MTNIIVVLPKIEDAKSIKNVLVRSGFSVMAACSTGAQALGAADALSGGIVICSYKLIDMAYSELYDYLPPGMDMLLLASPGYLSEVSVKDIVCLSMPLKVQELVSTVLQRQRLLLYLVWNAPSTWGKKMSNAKPSMSFGWNCWAPRFNQ